MQSEKNCPRKTDAEHSPWPVMVLAHNEEKHIAACLDSIFLADPEASFDIYVMVNGCTDRTEEIVREYQKQKPSVHLVSITLGDKCNAWNVFVHDIVPEKCPGRPIYFFVDGDAQFTVGSFSALTRTLEQDSHANAASAPPASGRSMAHDRTELINDHGLVANLYALRGDFVDRLKKNSVRIPLNLEGDDGMVGALVRWDLNPKEPVDPLRVAPCLDAGFIFESMNPTRVSDWKNYYKRMVRYGRRRYEFALLGSILKEKGLASMPADITEIYDGAKNLQLNWNGIYTITNWIALKQMRQIAADRSSA